VCSINMRGGARDGLAPYMPPCEILAATSSWLNSKALAVRVVLAHPRATFYPYTCRLCRGAVVVVAVLIDYDHIKVAVEMATRRRQS
jgi:hypothetical protein